MRGDNGGIDAAAQAEDGGFEIRIWRDSRAGLTRARRNRSACGFRLAKRHGRGRIGIDDRLVLREAGELRDDFAIRIHRDGIAVENKLVVSADGIAVTNRPAIGARERGHHLATNGGLVQV